MKVWKMEHMKGVTSNQFSYVSQYQMDFILIH